MRIIRKLLLAVSVSCGVLSLIASGANAQLEVRAEDGGHCPPVTKVGHHAEGGCPVEYRSTGHIAMAAYVPTPIIFAICDWDFEARVDESGQGWVTRATFSSEPPPGTAPDCTRTPCDEADGTMLPWPLQVAESSPDQEALEMVLCFRDVASGGGGGPQTSCEVHLPFSQQVAFHDHGIGADADYFCENGSSLIAIHDARFVDEVVGGPDIEIVH
jgi:hypothetical protein